MLEFDHVEIEEFISNIDIIIDELYEELDNCKFAKEGVPEVANGKAIDKYVEYQTDLEDYQATIELYEAVRDDLQEFYDNIDDRVFYNTNSTFFYDEGMNREIKDIVDETDEVFRECKIDIGNKEYTPFGTFSRGNFLHKGSPEEELIDSNDGKMEDWASEMNKGIAKLVESAEEIDYKYNFHFKDLEDDSEYTKSHEDYEGISKEKHEWVKGVAIVGGVALVGIAYATGVGEAATLAVAGGEILVEGAEAVAVTTEVAEGTAIGETIVEAETITGEVEGLETTSKEIIDGPYVRGGKPYGRPSYKKGQIEEVWEEAKGINGEVRDPNTGQILEWDKSKPRNGQWDMGHIEEAKYFDKWKEYQQGELTKEEFLEWYKEADNYRPESPSANRSHRYE